MTTVAQMIEWLKTLPQDAEVQCGVEETCGYDHYMRMTDVDFDASDVLDFTSIEDRAKYPNKAGRVIVQIRGE